jgi:hypothetical protein
MNKIIFISPEDLGSLKGISSFANAPAITKHLSSIDYHFILFSTLYQSGANHFQISKKVLPELVKESNFWSERVIDIDEKVYYKSKEKVQQILEGKLKFNTNDARALYLKIVIEINLINLFYATQTGNSFISVHNKLDKNLEFVAKEMDKELWLNLKNLAGLIKTENIPTITPKYSLFKRDLKRFEEISNSRLFRNYQSSMSLMDNESNLMKVKKEITTNSLRLFNKYGNYISLTDTTFNLIKFGKKIIDSFVKIIPPFVGDFIIASAETMMKNRRTI